MGKGARLWLQPKLWGASGMGFWEQCPAWGLPLACTPGKLPLWPPDMNKSQILKCCLSSSGVSHAPSPSKRHPPLTNGGSGTGWSIVSVSTSGTEKQTL